MGRAVMVHGLDMARLAVARAAAGGVGVVLISAEGAAGYAGVGWWRAMMAACGVAERAHILDCGAAPGRVLEALRAGQLRVVLRCGRVVWADLAERAADCGAELLAEAPAALDLAERGAALRLDAWLAGDTRGAIG